VTTTEEETTTTTTTAQQDKALAGDANVDGNVTIADAVAILQSIANKDKFELKPQGKINGDVDGQQGITGNDALMIQKVDAGVLDKSELRIA
jgi:hypothetical protein